MTKEGLGGCRGLSGFLNSPLFSYYIKLEVHLNLLKLKSIFFGDNSIVTIRKEGLDLECFHWKH